MTREMKEIMEELSAIETRSEEIRAAVPETAGEELESLTDEATKVATRKAELLARKSAIEAEEAEARSVENGKTKVTEVTPMEDKKMNLAELRNSHEYNMAYAEYVKTGNAEEVRSLLTDMVSGGTIPVPTMVEDAVQHAWADTKIMSRIQHVSVPGILEVPYESSATAAVAHTEGAAAVTEETLTIGTIEIKPVMLKKWISYTDEVEAMKGEAFLSYLNAEISQRIYELADKTAVSKMLATSLKTSVTHAFDATTIFAGLASLSDEAKNPVVIMSRSDYFNTFMSLTDTTGRPIYNIVTENGKPTYYINGCEVIFSGETSGKVIVVDLDALKANTPDGNNIKFKKDEYTLMTEDKVRLLGKLYLGVDVVKPGRTVVITKTA